MGSWIVLAFAAERAAGTIRETQTGAEARFAIEVWWPCDPATAREIDDSDERRHLLLPQVGEPVDVAWRGDVPARVARTRPLALPLPRLPFGAWIEGVAAHVPALAGMSSAEWAALTDDLDGEVLDTIESPEPLAPEQHLGLLGWLCEVAPAGLVERRLGWIALAAAPGARRAEAHGVDALFVALPPDACTRLAELQLVRFVEPTPRGP